MSFVVIIPARLGSTRLPNKPLLDICGKPMIQRVWERARESAATRVVIATDDARVAAAAEGFGAEVCMTRATHESGTDRLQEVAQTLALDPRQYIVNVQDDEPLIPPAVLDQVAHNLANSQRAGIATLAKRILSREDVFNPSAVEVVTDDSQHALKFSRAPLPWDREDWDREAMDRDGFKSKSAADATLDGEWSRHIGVYAY